MESSGKISEYIMSCRQRGIDILPPDINSGNGRFTASENGINYGLAAIKGVGKPVIEEIVRERKAAGIYNDATIKDINNLYLHFWNHDDSAKTITRDNYSPGDLQTIAQQFLAIIHKL